jgi:hypothetical protein
MWKVCQSEKSEYDNWPHRITPINWPFYDQGENYVGLWTADHYTIFREWCVENIGHEGVRWRHGLDGSMAFKSDADMILFLLRWRNEVPHRAQQSHA